MTELEQIQNRIDCLPTKIKPKAQRYLTRAKEGVANLDSGTSSWMQNIIELVKLFHQYGV